MRVLNWNDGNILQEVSANIQDYNYHACWMYVSFSFNHENGSAGFYLNGMRLEEQYLNLTYPTLTRINQTQLSYIGLNSVTRADYFYGLIDQLNVIYFVKSHTEIQYEATILFFYNFNSDKIHYDSGPNNIPGLSQDVYRLVSDNDSTLLLNTSESFFQSLGFTLLASNEYEFSIAFWLRLIITPSNKTNSAIAILQLSSLIEGLSSCTYSCAFSLHVYPNNENNRWIHLGVAYDSPEIYRFYVNEKLVHIDINRRYSSIITANSCFSVSIGGVYLNNSMLIKPANYEQMKCFSGIPVFNYTKMYGEIDDFTFHARVLEDLEFVALVLTKNASDNME
ncbi:unnamed protein product [Rotaria sp. Silwood1]|nr:unnamed protein product [Rotaria sp. Silwood1]CAF4904395.1 unnamed protein product [Rotaria sp. Silwood1]CAF5112948.1 unnamed protein product [Rotaria sp. Silwood1]